MVVLVAIPTIPKKGGGHIESDKWFFLFQLVSVGQIGIEIVLSIKKSHHIECESMVIEYVWAAPILYFHS